MIVFDLRPAERDAARRGGGVLALARALARAHPQTVDAFVLGDGGSPLAAAGSVGAAPVRTISAVRGHDVEIAHVHLDLDASFDAVTLPLRSRRLVVGCEGLPDSASSRLAASDAGDRARLAARLGLLLAADAIVVPSAEAAASVVALTGVDRRRVTVIGSGAAATEAGWREVADRVVEVYRRLERTSPPRRRNRRLAVVTPLPPAESGIAGHSARLLTAMHHDLDVEVVAFADGVGDHVWDFPVEPLADLPRAWASSEVDAVLYCVGNNRLHREAVGAMAFVPGFVLLHDVRLVDLIDRPSERSAADGLAAASIVRRAVSVLVQSEHAADLVRAEAGVDALNVGPIHCDPPPRRRSVELDDGLPWVVSAGIAHDVKQSDVVAAAMRRLVAAGEARAAFVGARGELFAGPDSGIVVTGHVDDDVFDEWVQRSAVMVQLRRVTNGESSAVAAAALARGVPLVVSDLGAMSELPDEAVVRLPVDATAADLADAVRDLLADRRRRHELRAGALAYAAAQTPAAQARRIVDAVFADV